MQPADGPVQEGPDDRLGWCVAGQLVEVALDGSGGAFLIYATLVGRRAAAPANYTAGRCYAATLK